MKWCIKQSKTNNSSHSKNSQYGSALGHEVCNFGLLHLNRALIGGLAFKVEQEDVELGHACVGYPWHVFSLFLT